MTGKKNWLRSRDERSIGRRRAGLYQYDRIRTAVHPASGAPERQRAPPPLRAQAAKHIERTEKQARAIIKLRVKNQVLWADDYDDPVERKPLKGLRANQAKRTATSAGETTSPAAHSSFLTLCWRGLDSNF